MPGDTEEIADNPGIFALRKHEVGVHRRRLPRLGENQVRIQVEASMISPGTELHFILDNHSRKAEYPVELGYMSAGRVVGMGSAVTEYLIGQRVLAVAGHSARHNVDTSILLALPDGLELRDACPAVLMAVSLRAIRAGQVRFGDPVAVFGLGLVGLYAVQLAKLAGAFPVIAVDPIARRRDAACAIGADHAIDPAADDVRQRVVALTGGDGAAVTIDATGSPSVIASLPAMTARCGRIAILGGVHAPVPMDLYSHIMKFDQSIVGCGKAMPRDYPHDERRNLATLIAMIHAGMIDPRSTVTQVVPVGNAPATYQRLLTDKDMLGVVFDWRAGVAT
jgi:L-iditol 2-dehydrogenase